MNNIAFVDLEIDGKGKIVDAGAVMAGKKLHTSRIAEFVKFISDADFLCGHNIVEHDYQYLKPGQGENPVFRITKKYVPLNR